MGARRISHKAPSVSLSEFPMIRRLFSLIIYLLVIGSQCTTDLAIEGTAHVEIRCVLNLPTAPAPMPCW